MNKFLILTICTIFAFEASASINPVKQEAMKDANSLTDKKLYSKYLQCYALDKIKKKKCIGKLSVSYIPESQKTNIDYIREFTYEAEKLGFLQFLKEKNKECDKINDGPLYNKDKLAYEVKCVNGKNFHMKFDYENQKWSITE